MRPSTSPGCSGAASTVSMRSGAFVSCRTAARSFRENPMSPEADRARVDEAGDAGAAIEDLGVALGDLAVKRQHRGIEIARRARLVREMTEAILAPHQGGAVLAGDLPDIGRDIA